MESILILTYECNFRCTYCDIDKRKEKMSDGVLENTLSFIENLDIPLEKMKFFGGEPLLEEKNIRKIVNQLQNRVGAYYITTNASLLLKGFLEYAENNNIHVTVSLDGDKETTEENRKTLSGASLYDLSLKNSLQNASFLRVNQVITSKTSHKLYENFLYLYGKGFRKFNFLPEYYREWSKEGLRDFISEMRKIRSYISDHPIELVNSENYSPTSFFNFGLVIDTNGSIYGTNLILSKEFEKYKNELCIGDIYKGITQDIFHTTNKDKYLENIQKYVQAIYPREVLRSVSYIDSIISEFTISYDQQRKSHQ